jgi:hypothetical protein
MAKTKLSHVQLICLVSRFKVVGEGIGIGHFAIVKYFEKSKTSRRFEKGEHGNRWMDGWKASGKRNGESVGLCNFFLDQSEQTQKTIKIKILV